MRVLLFLLFIAVPFVELGLLVRLGMEVGFWWTMALVVGTAVIGAVVLQAQGVQTMQRVSQSMAAGEPPVGALVDGFFLVAAGAFLMTPGVLTDITGLLFLVPPVRRFIARNGVRWAFRNANVKVETFTVGDGHPQSEFRSPHRERPQHGNSTGPVIDGEFEEVRPRDPKESAPAPRRD